MGAQQDSGEALRPGWHPDPWGDGSVLRWWDGQRWTSATKPLQDKPKRRRRIAFPLTFATFVLVAIVIAVTMTQRHVAQVDAFGASVKFDSGQIKDEQSQMQAKLAVTESDAKSGQSAHQSAVSFAGDWKLATGHIWHIRQFGAAVALNEELPPYGITAVGQGAIAGNRLAADFQIVDGSRGHTELELQGENVLSGVIVNLTTQMQYPVVFNRMS